MKKEELKRLMNRVIERYYFSAKEDDLRASIEDLKEAINKEGMTLEDAQEKDRQMVREDAAEGVKEAVRKGIDITYQTYEDYGVDYLNEADLTITHGEAWDAINGGFEDSGIKIEALED